MSITFTAFSLALNQLFVFDTKNQGFHGFGGLQGQFKSLFDEGQDFEGYIPAQLRLRLEPLASRCCNVCHHA